MVFNKNNALKWHGDIKVYDIERQLNIKEQGQS